MQVKQYIFTMTIMMAAVTITGSEQASQLVRDCVLLSKMSKKKRDAAKAVFNIYAHDAGDSLNSNIRKYEDHDKTELILQRRTLINQNAQLKLEALARMNFLVKLDERKSWFSYFRRNKS